MRLSTGVASEKQHYRIPRVILKNIKIIKFHLFYRSKKIFPTKKKPFLECLLENHAKDASTKKHVKTGETKYLLPVVALPTPKMLMQLVGGHGQNQRKSAAAS